MCFSKFRDFCLYFDEGSSLKTCKPAVYENEIMTQNSKTSQRPYGGVHGHAGAGVHPARDLSSEFRISRNQ